jgi:long-chain acyl-CoA synthetase
MAATRAAQLADRVEPGQVVIAVLPAGAEFVAWFCAAIAAGVRLLPMHTQIPGPEALAIAERSAAVAAVVAEGVAAEAALGPLAMEMSGAARLRSGDTGESQQVPGGVVLGSSGTTGLPKLVLRESAALDADAAGMIVGMGLTSADRVLFATPLSHSYGVDVLVGALAAGAALRVVQQFDAESLAAELELGGATVLPGVPFIFEALARRKRRRDIALRLALSAGSPLSPRVRDAFEDAWGVGVGQLYGATELGTVAINASGTMGFDPTSIGRPLAGVSMRIVDADDPERELPLGHEGQLAVRAGSMLTGYLDGEMPAIDGHLLTGDLARTDESGRVWITGRLKQLIDVGAYKVNPLEVEGVLATHPSVAECVVVPLAASDTLQRVRAVVTLRDAAQPVSPEALRQYLRERLSAIKVPRIVEIVERLPKSPTGKVLRDRV